MGKEGGRDKKISTDINDSPHEEGKNMSTIEKEILNNRYCSPAESLKQSLKEVNLMKDRKQPEISLQDWLAGIKEDKDSGIL